MKPGPLSERTWGRIWAEAFINAGTKGGIEHSPRNAVLNFLGDFVEPLFDPEKTKKKKHCAKDVYDELEAQLKKDKQHDTHEVEKLRNGIDLQVPGSFQKKIIDMMHGNQWILIDGPNRFILEQNIPRTRVGAKPATDPLTLSEWARVYADAVIDDNMPPPGPLYDLLKKDAAGAVQMFVSRNHPNSFPHNVSAPILKLPIFTELSTHKDLPPDLNPVTNPGVLQQLLTDLAADIETDYEVALRICLCC